VRGAACNNRVAIAKESLTGSVSEANVGCGELGGAPNKRSMVVHSV
jgi:hypothetical protein